MSDKAIGDALTAMMARLDEDLYALTAEQLNDGWLFHWDDRRSLAWNLYEFSDRLEMHKRRCRRWEEHHNGSECVVERVRDRYILPRVKSFTVQLLARRT